MMRVTAFLALGTVTCWAAFGGSSPQNTTYVEGNLSGVSPDSGGTLLFPDDQAMVFKTGDKLFQIPYAKIGKAELGAVKVHSHHVPLYQAPLYKAWVLSKRLTGKTQLLTVAFKGDEGEDVSMTVELPRPTAVEVLATIDGYTGKGPVVGPPLIKLTEDQITASGPANTAKTPWWGDDYWKTPRNSDKWNSVRAASAP